MESTTINHGGQEFRFLASTGVDRAARLAYADLRDAGWHDQNTKLENGLFANTPVVTELHRLKDAGFDVVKVLSK